MRWIKWILVLLSLGGTSPAFAQFGSNATKLRGFPICGSISPTSNQVLSWDGSNNCWKAGVGGAGLVYLTSQTVTAGSTFTLTHNLGTTHIMFPSCWITGTDTSIAFGWDGRTTTTVSVSSPGYTGTVDCLVTTGGVGAAGPQGTQGNTGTNGTGFTYRGVWSGRPGSPQTNDVILISDANAACSSGGGSSYVQCVWTGSTWSQLGGSGTGGGLVLICELTASTSASLDFKSANCPTAPISATYDDYVIKVVDLLPSASGANIKLRVSTDNGSTYAATAYTNDSIIWSSTCAGVGGGAPNGLQVNGGSTDGIDVAQSQENANFGASSQIQFGNPGGSQTKKMFYEVGVYQDKFIGDIVGMIWQGRWASSSAINAFQILPSTGTLTSGTVRLYGWAK